MSTTLVNGMRQKFRPLAEWYLAKLAAKRQSAEGAELPDSVPVAPPIGYNRQPTMVEHIRNMVRSEELRRAALAAGAETFEEADDFEVADDIYPSSRFEVPDDLEPVAELKGKKAKAERPVPPAKGKQSDNDEVAPDEGGAKPPTGADPE